MVRTAPVSPVAPVALVALSVAVVLAAAGAVVHGVRGVEARPGDPVPAVTVTAPGALGAPTDPGAPSPAGGALRTAGGTAGVDAEPVTFTLRELHDGEVSLARFSAFWDAELERIRQAPCPGPTAPGTTVVVATVGATPPPHLAAEYPDYAPLLAAARTEAAAACA